MMISEIITRLSKLDAPEICPGSYSFHAYCRYDNPDHDFNEFPHEPIGAQTRGEAVAQLRSIGWILHRDGTATCPKCAALLRAKEASKP